MQFKIIFVTLILLFHNSTAETLITLIHTSDIHGVYTNTENPLKLGGIARVKKKIDQIRSKNQNHLLLDSGDWTEGTIFYTLNSGEANHRLMESFNYDAIVLGNHEWLVGPEELYQGLSSANFKIPILGANIDLKKSTLNLSKYIQPYIIKEIAGLKVGIIGLSTFDIIYDNFFEPAELKDPVRIANRYVRKLKNDLNCDVVILLTHTGLRTDKKIAQSVPGIDIIVGGHTHILTPEPLFVNGVPIVHAGYWGQYVGEYELSVSSGKVHLKKHKIYQIDETISEDVWTNQLVNGFETQIINKFGQVFNDRIFHSSVHLPTKKSLAESALANWAVDAIKNAGKTNLALDVGQYYRRDLLIGQSSTVDFFNLFPHIYSNKTQKAWTIYNMEIKGRTIQQLIGIFSKLSTGVRISGGRYRIDGDKAFSNITGFYVGQNKLEPARYYKVSATKGVLMGLEYLKLFGADIGIRKIKDTGLEAWREIQKFIQEKSPVTSLKTTWEGRVRTVQPDIHIPSEQIEFFHSKNKLEIHFKVINAGLTKIEMPELNIRVDRTPKNTLDHMWVTWSFPKYIGHVLAPGKRIDFKVELDTSGWLSGVYPVDIKSLPDSREIEVENNEARSYFYL